MVYTMENLRVALDWTPNSNHCGFYVAQAHGFYAAEGLSVTVVPPSQSYSKEETPARSVVEGRADLCVAPTESVVSCWTSDRHDASTRPVCVAAILQHNTSAIVSLKSNEAVRTAADLAGKKYASYEGRFEMAIVNHLIKSAGGQGDSIEVLPPKLNCFEQVVQGSCDATWVFMGWEGVQAKARGIELNVFGLEEHKVPYGYSPCLLASQRLVSEKQETLKKFLRATARGFELAHADPKAAADALFDMAAHDSLEALGRDFLLQAQQYLSDDGCLVDRQTGKWGTMDPKRWSDFVDFLNDNSLLGDFSGKVKAEELYNSSFLTE